MLNKITTITNNNIFIENKTTNDSIQVEDSEKDKFITDHLELIRIIKRYEYCHGWTLLIAPDHLPKKQLLIDAGINLDKVMIIHKKHCHDLLFRAYQALKQDNFSALVIWGNLLTENEMKLLEIKAEYTTTALYLLDNKEQNTTIISH